MSISIIFNPFSGNLDFVGSSGSSPASRYAQSFTTGSWVGPSGGYYTITILAATHGLGVTPSTTIFSFDGTNYTEVFVDQITMNASGDVTIQVPSSPDLRFNGLFLLI